MAEYSTPGMSRPIATAAPPHLRVVSSAAGTSVRFQRRPERARAFFILNDRSSASEVHAAHSAHASTGTSRHRWALLLRQLGDHGLGRDQQAGDRCRTLQCRAHHFGRVDDPLGDEIAVLPRLRVIAVGIGVLLQDLADHDRTVFAGIDGDLTRGPGERLAHDLDAGLLVVVVGADLLERLACAQQRNAPARQDTFLNRGAGRVHGVIYAVFALLHLDLGRAADADYRDAAGELGQSLLQLLPVVVGGSFLDLRLDLGNTRLDVGLLARATDDRGVLLVDHHFLGTPKHIDGHILKLDAEVGGDHGAAREDGNILEHRLAAVAEAGGFDRRDLEPAAQLVDHEGGQRLTLYVLGNDQQRLAGLHHRLQQRQQLLQSGQLLFVDQDIRILHLDPHFVGIGDEVGRDVAAVELHALDHFQLGLERLCFLDRDHAFVADLLHRIGDETTNLCIAITDHFFNDPTV